MLTLLALIDYVLIEHSGLVGALLTCRYSGAAYSLFPLKYYLTPFTEVVNLQDTPMLLGKYALILSSYYSFDYIFPGLITT
jgi:hypothetical protein